MPAIGRMSTGMNMAFENVCIADIALCFMNDLPSPCSEIPAIAAGTIETPRSINTGYHLPGPAITRLFFVCIGKAHTGDVELLYDLSGTGSETTSGHSFSANGTELQQVQGRSQPIFAEESILSIVLLDPSGRGIAGTAMSEWPSCNHQDACFGRTAGRHP
jgi:hypothetical protein